MQVSVCDYCLLEGRITETSTKIAVSHNLALAGCKKHQKILLIDVNADRTSKEFQSMVDMVSKNLEKKGKVLASLKKRK